MKYHGARGALLWGAAEPVLRRHRADRSRVLLCGQSAAEGRLMQRIPWTLLGTFVCVLSGGPATAQPAPLWIEQLGTRGMDSARAVASDGAAGAFMAGLTYGSLDGPNAGDSDAFLARYDGAGKQAWITQLGTVGFDYATGLAPDGAGG